MATQLAESPLPTHSQTVVATYSSHADAEEAVRLLVADGLPITSISIIGRNFETVEDIQGYYRPADAAVAGAGQGAWFGGIFGLMFGAMGLFVFPAVGLLLVLGPLSGMIAGAVGGAGIGALLSALIALGIPKDHALKYQERLQAGEFLVVVHEGAREADRAESILKSSSHTSFFSHDTSPRTRL
jgi:hypothetical protein